MYLNSGRRSLSPSLSLTLTSKSLPIALKESEVLNKLENEPSTSLALNYFNSITNSKSFEQTGLTYRTMIRRLGDSGDVDAIQSLLQQMKMDSIPCSADSFTNLINTCIKSGSANQALKMLYRIDEFGCRPTVKMYNLILDAFLREKEFQMVSSTYRSMKADRIEPNVYTYNTLLKALCKNNRIEAAKNLLLQMPSKGCFPDDVSFTTVVSCMCDAGMVDEANGELESKSSFVSVSAYNAVMKGFRKEGRVREVVRLLERISEDGLVANVVSYSTVISSLVDRHVDLAFAVFGKMIVRGCSPNLHTFSSLMKGCFGQGRVNEALGLWDRLDCEPNVVLYNTLIHGLSSCGRMVEAVAVFEDMEKKGCSPSIVTYGALIDGFAKTGDLSGASGTWDRMMADGGCGEVNIVVYTSMVDVMCQNLMFDEARALIERMDCKPNTVMFNTLIGRLAGSGRTERARTVFEEMTTRYGCEPNVTTYNELIDGLLKSEETKEGIRIFKEIDEKGIVKPDLVTYNLVLHSVSRSGMLGLVLQIIAKMVVSGIEPDEFTFTTVVDAYSRQGRVDTAIRLKDRLSFGGYWFPDIVAYNNLLWGICHRFGPEKAGSYLEKMMKDDGMKPNFATWNVLVRGLFSSLGNLGSVSLFDHLLMN
ncbi:Pentatricopeptide repeat-containing protein At3g48810 [Linum grandiflorum]